jgi:hypothetical protein
MAALRETKGTSVPTAGRAVATATPKSPVRGQRAAIEKVWRSTVVSPDAVR